MLRAEPLLFGILFWQSRVCNFDIFRLLPTRIS
jgi:hypothetical protein